MIAPDEEVLRIVEPAREHVGVERQHLLVQLGAPVGAGDLVDRRLDADLRQALLDQHAQRLVDGGKAEVERQRGLETVRIAGLGEQLFRLRDVGVEAVLLRPGDFGRLAGGAAEHRLAEAVQHRVHDLLVRHRIGHRLADLEIVERRLRDVHAEILDAVRERRRDDVELAGVLQLDEILVRQLIGDVGVAALQQRAAVACRRNHAPDDALDLRQRPADPLVVALEDDFGARGPLHHAIGAGACGVLLGVFEAPGVLFRGVLLDQFGVDHAWDDHGQIGDRQPVLLQEIDAHGVIVDDDELFGLGQRAGAHLEGREAADADGAVERPLDVLGGDRRAVLEGGVLLQLEGGGHVADVHVFGEFHLELVAVVIGGAVDRLHLVADQPVVAVPRHFISGHVGADAMDVEIVRPAFRDDQQRFRPRLRLRARPDAGMRQHAACNRAGHAFQKIATLHLPLRNLKRNRPR